MEDLLARLDQIKVDAAALQMPLYDAKVLLERAYVLQAMGRGADMLPLAQQARARLLGDRMPSLGSFSQGYERSYYLDTFAKQAEGQIIAGDHEGLLATCEEVIRDFETRAVQGQQPVPTECASECGGHLLQVGRLRRVQVIALGQYAGGRRAHQGALGNS